jgi:hypothetical protein
VSRDASRYRALRQPNRMARERIISDALVIDVVRVDDA